MAAGKMRAAAWATGVAALLILCAGAQAGDAAELSPMHKADSLVSVAGNAFVRVGGEMRVDYTYRNGKTTGSNGETSFNLADLQLKNVNLRLNAGIGPNVRALFKIDLSSQPDRFRYGDDILEEALLVMNSLGGSGFGFFAGKGRAPYGQDISLGILQSYHHVANQADSAEGRIYIIDPPGDSVPDPDNPGQKRLLPPMRPGQFDRAFLAGFAYEQDALWRIELAAFQPTFEEYRPRLANRSATDPRQPGVANGSDIGFASRAWWRPTETLTLEISGMAAHSSDMGNKNLRQDLAAFPDAQTRGAAFAVSAGFDWRPGPWRLFGEYQHAWDWNFTKGYNIDIGQIGAARDIAGAWRVGGMAEAMRIHDASGNKTLDHYYKLAFNVRYAFSTNLFVLAEYGHEWFRREQDGTTTERRRGDFFGLRLGFSF